MNLECLILTVIKQIWRYIYTLLYKDTCLRVPRGNRDGLKCTKLPIYQALEYLPLMAGNIGRRKIAKTLKHR